MLSVIICTYRRPALLRRVLEDLAAQQVPAGFVWELIVVDNNSGDDTQAVVGAFAQHAPLPVRYVFEARQGKSFALNTGIEQAHHELLALTDDDVRLDAGWAAAMAEAFERHRCDLVAGRIQALWEVPQPDWYVTTGPFGLMDVIVQFEEGSEAKPITRPPFGANMGLRRSRVLAAGGFRTDLGPRGDALTRAEDTELGARMMQQGSVCQYVPQALVHHPVEPHRATKAYLLRWYYFYGKSQTVRSGIPAGARRLFGVPLYMYRKTAECALRWMLTLRPDRRFYHKLQTYLSLGEGAQSRSMPPPA